MAIDVRSEFDVRGTDFLADELASLAERLRASTATVRGTRSGGGSGVVWSSDGLIITNAHVAPNKTATVELSDGREFSAKVIDRVAERDLAALRVDADALPAASIGDSRAIRVGQLVFAMGNPLGISNALTSGIIHARGPAHRHSRREWLQADITLMPGNSGGPLADATGAVIGINSMIAGSLALAVPSSAVLAFLRGESGLRLGIAFQPVFARNGRTGTYGLLVMEVAPSSAAAQAGLLLGDIIIGANGAALANADGLEKALDDAAAAGNRLQLDIVRGPQRLARDVVLGQPKQAKNQAA